MDPDLWGGLILLALVAFILWAAAGLPIPEAIKLLLTGVDKDDRD